MDRVVFVKNILLFTTNSPFELLRLSHTNSVFRDTILNNPYSLAAHVFYNWLVNQNEILLLQQQPRPEFSFDDDAEEPTAASNVEKATKAFVEHDHRRTVDCDRFFQHCCFHGIGWVVQCFLDAVRTINDSSKEEQPIRRPENQWDDGYLTSSHSYNTASKANNNNNNNTSNQKNHFAVDLAWYQAAQGGHVEVLQVLDTWYRNHQSAAEVERIQNCFGINLLHQASVRGHLGIVEFILLYWEHLDLDSAAEKCLLSAVSSGQMKVIDFLLSGGRLRSNGEVQELPWIEIKRTFQTIETQSQLQWTVLHEAIANNQSAEIVERLLTIREGIDVDIDDESLREFKQEVKKRFSSTLFSLAAHNNNVDAMRVLARLSISPKAQDEDRGDSNPRQNYLSRRRGNESEHGYERMNFSPLDEALVADAVEAFKFLMSQYDDDSMICDRKDDLTIGKPGNLLLFAAVIGSQKILEHLISLPKHISKTLINQEYQGWSVLSLVCQQMSLPVVQAINTRSHWSVPRFAELNLEHFDQEKRLCIVDLLIRGGADLDFRPNGSSRRIKQKLDTTRTDQRKPETEVAYFHDQQNDYYYQQSVKNSAAPIPISGDSFDVFHVHPTSSSGANGNLNGKMSTAHLLDLLAMKYRGSLSFFSFRSLGGWSSAGASSSSSSSSSTADATAMTNTDLHYQKSKDRAMDSFYFKVLMKLMEAGAGSPRIRNRARREACLRFQDSATEKVTEDNFNEEDLFEQDMNKNGCVVCFQEFSHFSRSHVCFMCNTVCCSSCGGFSAKHDVGFYQEIQVAKDDSYCKSCLVWMRE